MRRNLSALTNQTFDVLIIGGGVVGASAAWDASARGLSVALIEADDFGSGTSANCLKIVHGGLRYLQSLDVRRMRESIVERAFWLRAAPHLVEPLPVLVGTYRELTRNRAVSRVAMAVTDAVGFDRNTGVPPSRELPAGRTLDREEVERLSPEMAARGEVTGGALFYDALMYSPERLVFELVLAAGEQGAEVANHVRYEEPIFSNGELVGVRARDTLDSNSLEIRTRSVLNAAGPSASAIAQQLVRRTGFQTGQPRDEYSLALNLVLPGTDHDAAFALRARDDSYESSGFGESAKRELFFVPWRGRLLVGTGHYPWTEGESLEEELGTYRDHFLAEVNRAWSGPDFRSEDVLLVHRGLLPVHGKGRAVDLVPRHLVKTHRRQQLPNVVSVIGVKFTTGRLAAEEALDKLCSFAGLEAGPCRTRHLPLPGGETRSMASLRRDARGAVGGRLADDIIEHIVRTYGSRWKNVVETRNRYTDWARRVIPEEPVIQAQLHHAVEREMAVTPDDLLHRRTELGPRGIEDPKARKRAETALARGGEERRLA